MARDFARRRSCPDEPRALDVADAEPAEAPPIPDDVDDESAPAEPVPEDIPAAADPPAPWNWEAIGRWDWCSPGALAWWSLAAVRIVRFHRLLRDVEPMPAEWQAEIDELAGRLGLRRPPTACLVPGDVPPMLWAVGRRARLLVPARLWATLGDDERTALLLHELAHLKRRDHWVRWLELVVAGLYWWHPAVWWLRRALREAEEQCCDAWVVWAMPRRGQDLCRRPRGGPRIRLGCPDRRRPRPPRPRIGNGHVSCLKRRLRMIVRARTPKDSPGPDDSPWRASPPCSCPWRRAGDRRTPTRSAADAALAGGCATGAQRSREHRRDRRTSLYGSGARTDGSCMGWTRSRWQSSQNSSTSSKVLSEVLQRPTGQAKDGEQLRAIC